ncbi:DM13 domain-containing protein [Actinokineospora spheciospongiae]|uniref:DM13 domain-containing protein n=1 Tax=Actinokineospora spheciospongiae TaxID=909613 RepID=UPI000D70DF72|nr:DM13 domain-containing protein [Actinokineospora spheciospongiae]PWW62049.1 electron transfer DM13 [Actinokineospora spheciospongiae]
MRGSLRRRVWWGAGAAVLAVVIIALWAFQPWKLFTHSRVDEPLAFEVPVVSTTPATPATTTATPAPAPEATTTTAPTPTGPAVLAEGRFVSQEHPTSGAARLLEQGGARVLRLEGFSTSDGPDVHVWLSTATAGGDWHKYDDGRVVKLGKIKATDGNHNYAVPADADLAGLRSVVIWCDRFNVAFGSAPLAL